MIDSHKSEYETEDLEYNLELTREHNRRLRALKKTAARYGDSADPHIGIEIKKIERQIAQLAAERQNLEQQEQSRQEQIARVKRDIERKEKQEAFLLRKSNDAYDLGVIAFILCFIALLFWFFTRDNVLVICMTLCIGISVLYTLVIIRRQSR